MPDDASKPKLDAEPTAKSPARPKREARPRHDIDPVEAARDFMDRHPILMARLAE